MVRSWYPYDPSHGMAHILTLIFQFYWLIFCMADANLLDVLFCSWLLFACEQIQHLKNIMKPLMEFSATLDTVVPNSGELFKVELKHIYMYIFPSTEKLRKKSLIITNWNNYRKREKSKNKIEDEKKERFVSFIQAGSAEQPKEQEPLPPVTPPQGENMLDMDLRGIYSNRTDFTTTFRPTAGMTFNGGVGPNGLTKKQEMLVRSAIKYWVERHKHIVRWVYLFFQYLSLWYNELCFHNSQGIIY